MPIEYENTGAGATDISGMPPPGEGVRTPKELGQQRRKETNQSERRPGMGTRAPKGNGSNPLQGVGDALGGLGGDVQNVAQGVGNAARSAPSAGQQLIDRAAKSAIDFGEEWNRAPGDVWAFGRAGYQKLSGAYAGSVNDLFAQQDAGHRIGQQVATFAAESVPLVGLFESGQNLMALEQEREGQITDAQRRQQMQQNQVGAVQGAPGQALQDVAGGPFGGAGGIAERVAAGVGLTGVSVLDGLLSNNKDEQNHALAWIGASAVLSGFHVPAPARRFLLSHFGEWPMVERLLGDAAAHKNLGDQAVTDAKKYEKAATEYLSRKLGATAGQAAGTAQAPVESTWTYTRNHMRGEPVPRDPRLPLKGMSGSTLDAAKTHLRALNGAIEDVRSGLWADAHHGSEPNSILRATAGLDRSVGASFDEYERSALELLKGSSQKMRVDIAKAAEGDRSVYKALNPTGKLLVDSWAQIRSELRQASMGTDYAENFVPNWWPRVDDIPQAVRRVGRPSASALAREARRHRALEAVIDPRTGLKSLGQKFATVQATNTALKEARASLLKNLLDTGQELRSDVAGDPEAQAIRKLAVTDAQQAMERATRMSEDHFPLKSEDFVTGLRVARHQARAIASHKGLNELSQTLIKAEHPQGGEVLRTAIAKAEPGSREAQRLVQQGYEPISDPKFRGYFVDGNFNKVFSRYLNRDFGPQSGALAKVAQLERRLVRMTMYSPAMHGANILRRKLQAAEMHPILFAAYTKKMHGTPDEVDALRRQARRAGVQPPRLAQNWRNQFADTMESAFGHSGFSVKDVPWDQETKLGRLMTAIDSRPKPMAHIDDRFWRWVSDFGHMMYHVEHDAARAGGMPEQQATEYAARRANSWMGTVLPEDTNPTIQKLARIAFFAPNWWRTEAELLTNLYRRSGIYKDRATALYAATEAVKTAGAQFALAHLGGNALNYAMSGHLQSQNQQGRQNDIEVTNPGVLRALQATGLLPDGVDVNTGLNSKTGARVTLKNPFGGQWEDIEGALGFQSGYAGKRIGPDVQAGPVDAQLSVPGAPSDVVDGGFKFFASRLSPIADTSAALANVDLYRSITNRQMDTVIPGEEPLRVSPASAAAAAIYALPGGQAYASQMQRDMQQNGQDTTSLFGTQVPGSVQGWLAPMKSWGARTALSGILGVNAPFATAQKTRGTPLNDADYQKVKQLSDEYNRQQSVAGAEMLSGQMTPWAWLQQYQNAKRAHAAQMSGLFKNAPEYVNGAEGLANSWEQFYADSTNPDGSVDQGKLATLQQQFAAEHSPAEMAAMQSQLRKNENANPASALYYKTLDQYDEFQAGYAQEHGIDVTELRQDISQYNALWGDSQSQRKYLAQHPELRAYDTAVRNQWDRTLPGVLYAFFHGPHTTLQRTLKARGMTMPELEQDVAAA